MAMASTQSALVKDYWVSMTDAYQWLLGQGIDARHIAIAGDSSGGGLAVTTLLRARELGLPTAAALMLMSPWVDMAVSGLPPTYVQVGEDETLLGESVRFGEAARAAGVDIRVDVFPGQQHTFQMAAGHVPESDDAIAGFAEWVRPRLGL
jgi:acetyl esterase/lipase